MSEEKGKKKKGINPFMIIVVVLLLVIVGMVAYFVFVKSKPAATASTNMVAVQKAVVEATWSADEFLVNLADTDSERYLKSTIKLVYDSSNKKALAELDGNKDAIRDAMISAIRAKKSADLHTVGGTDILKTDIIKRVNKLLGSDIVIKVFYYDFLIQ